MMRELPEWVGKSPDTLVPPRIRLRIFQRQGGFCPVCDRPLRPGAWDLDHKRALINGGAHAESNLQAVCRVPCHSDKSKTDVAEKSRVYERQLSHAGIKRSKRPIPGGKNTPWRRRMNGRVVRRSG
jgi:5-methylcytosine-specific restriction protein A